MSGFKDGMLDYRNWLTGKPIALGRVDKFMGVFQ